MRERAQGLSRASRAARPRDLHLGVRASPRGRREDPAGSLPPGTRFKPVYDFAAQAALERSQLREGETSVWGPTPPGIDPLYGNLTAIRAQEHKSALRRAV